LDIEASIFDQGIEFTDPERVIFFYITTVLGKKEQIKYGFCCFCPVSLRDKRLIV